MGRTAGDGIGDGGGRGLGVDRLEHPSAERKERLKTRKTRAMAAVRQLVLFQ